MRHWAEGVARDHLERLGFTTQTQNYAVRGGEIDLVMRDREVVVFVEVRQRSSGRFGTPAESLDARKRRRLRLVALHYLKTHFGRDDLPVRFDAVLITGAPPHHRIEHLQNAF